MGKTKLPTHIDINIEDDPEQGLAKDSVVLLEQVRTLDKRRLREKVGRLSENLMPAVDKALLVSLGLAPRHLLLGEEPGRAVAASTLALPKEEEK